MKYFIFTFVMLLTQSVSALECSFQGHNDLGKEILQEINSAPISCKNQNVHLTFDDGPSPQVTPIVLSELKKRNVKATFFVTTTNLDPGHSAHLQNASLVGQTLREGHLIASHGHDHNAYDLRLNAKGEVLEDGFSQHEKEHQIGESIELLNKATGNEFSKQRPLLFRLPYGRGAMPSERELNYMADRGTMRFTSQNYGERLAEYRRQSPALHTLAGPGFSHLGWNNDSGDSSYSAKLPSNAILKSFIIKNLKSMCGGPATQVALFHDIKLMNTVSLPLILDLGKCMGLKFISPDEMMRNKESLTRTSVLIENKAIQTGTAKTIEDILRTVAGAGSAEASCESSKEKGCFSEQYKKYYQECEGGDSVCHNGRWYARHDPEIVLNCQLTY